ncbi:MAG: pyridoxamine 5'-phosphate oxidase family protein [Methyloceanibacter sp.]|uniref:pyridoxamine 5'-phosphate oxidase family protein n=1 Tax=Methyloceanibacter sp. TaxID=1965321 RepID=UPI003EE13DE0
MPSAAEMKAKFWNALESDRTIMLGLQGNEDVHPRPMTAMVEDESGPIWFFTANDTEIPRAVGSAAGRAVATFASKGHDLFATVHGTVRVDNDPAKIDKFWNSYVAAWFEGGKNDPKVTLLRLDPEHAEIWLDESSFLAGIKMLFGADPKEEYKDKVAEVGLR